MEKIHGENLDVQIKRKFILQESLLKIYANQIIDAIIYMHSCNVIHRFVTF